MENDFVYEIIMEILEKYLFSDYRKIFVLTKCINSIALDNFNLKIDNKEIMQNEK